MTPLRPSVRRRLAALLPGLASAAFACLALAQGAGAGEAVERPSPPAGIEAAPAGTARVGDATAGLLALQREGSAASPQPRPITGDVAGRSYQRYLKSFEQPIPERFGFGTAGGGSSQGGAGR